MRNDSERKRAREYNRARERLFHTLSIDSHTKCVNDVNAGKERNTLYVPVIFRLNHPRVCRNSITEINKHCAHTRIYITKFCSCLNSVSHPTQRCTHCKYTTTIVNNVYMSYSHTHAHKRHAGFSSRGSQSV